MTSRFAFTLAVTLFPSLTLVALAADRHVPGDYPTIQAAVTASADGDTVIVEPGTYYENVSVSRSLTLTSADANDPAVVAATIINAGGAGSAVTFSGTETNYYEIKGFTITGANAGGVSCASGDLLVSHCVFADNTSNSKSGKGAGIANDSTATLTVLNSLFTRNVANGYGGGIFSDQGVLTVIGCEFIENSARTEGGAIATDYDRVTIRNCTFRNNTAANGGAVHSSHHGAVITNCTFAFNSAVSGGAVSAKELRHGDLTQRITNCTFYGNVADYGGAVSARLSGNQVLTSCIFWDNVARVEGPQIACEKDGDVWVSYSCVQDGKWDVYVPSGTLHWLDGNIEVDPLFANPQAADFHLQSLAGRWDPTAETWVIDKKHSPCIDAGDPASDWTAELAPNGRRINMGAFGGTALASKSPAGDGCIADLDLSGSVDAADLELLLRKWLDAQISLPEDLNSDGIVDLRDFAILASCWGSGQ